MANYSSLKAAIQAVITTNGNNEITGAIMQNVLLAMVNSLGAGYQFAGIAATNTNPGTPDQNVFYLAFDAGTYTNFGSTVLTTGQIGLFVYNGSWTYTVKTIAELVDNLTAGGHDKYLSAEMGKTLQEEVVETNYQIDGEKLVDKAFQWSDGYVDVDGVVKTSTTSQFCQPILFKAGETLTYKCGGNYGRAIVTTANNNPIAVGSSNFVVAVLLYSVANIEYTTTFDVDTYVVISIQKATASLSIKANKLPLVKYSGYEDVPLGTNILDPSTLPTGLTRYIRRTDGVTLQTGGYGYTDFIKIPPEGLVGSYMLPGSGSYAGPVILYDADKKYIGSVTQHTIALPSDGAVYARFNLGNPASIPEGKNYAVYKGTHRPENFNAYTTPGKRVGGEIIKENSIPLDRMQNTFSNNLIKRVWTGVYYVPGTGNYNTNSSYDATDRIVLKPNTEYVANSQVRSPDGVVLFKADGTVSRSLGTKSFTTASDEVMAVLTFSAISSAKYMLQEGTVSGEYEPYKLQFTPDIIPYKEVPDGSITQSKFAPGVSLPSTPNPFNSFPKSGTIASGETLLGDTIFLSNRQVLSAEIIGSITDILIGVGLTSIYGAWLQITPTEVKVIYGSSSTVYYTYTHGLTLGTRTKVVITIGTSDYTFNLINDAGDRYSNTMRQFVGTPFIKNNGSASINATLRYGTRIGGAHIWCAGDSYWSFNDPARIPRNLANLGATEMLVVARGGESANSILPSIQALIEAGGRPSYIVWALGMNGGTDSSGNVNSNWMSAVTTFLELCEQTGITPVFCTIPTVPDYTHDALNAWIRNSGYRYIDIAEEVEQSGTNTWRGWGTDDALLSSDEVHPTTAGALQIASRIVVDFPEITQLNP